MKMIARITLMVITLLLLLATIAVLTATPAHAESQFKWQHFGTDPYATSRNEAMRTREDAFRKLGIPQDVIAILMIATDKPGEKVRIVNGDKLDAMISKGGVVHKNVIVAFVKPPISGKMEYAAPAEKWQVTSEGRIFTIFAPDICGNWSVVIQVPLVPLTPISVRSPPVATVSTAPVFTTSACPNGFTLIANAWSLGSLGGLRNEAEKLIKEAIERDSHEAMKLDAYKPADFSRTMGGRLRSEVKTRAQISADLPIRYLDPRTAKVVRNLGVMRMERGVGNFRFAEDPRAYVIEVVFPPDFVSPAMSGGEHRLRVFGYEWKKWCALNGHGAALLP